MKVHHIKAVVLKEKEAQLNRAAKRLVFLSDYRQINTNNLLCSTTYTIDFCD